MSDERQGVRGAKSGAVVGVVILVVALAVLLVLRVTTGSLSTAALFIALASVMLVLALAALWESVRTIFGGGPPEVTATSASAGQKTSLFEEKGTLLRAIKDIAFEREVGKISEDDFKRLDAAYRTRASDVLRLLDEDIAPFLDRAAREVDGAVAAASDRKKASAKKSKRPSVACDACGTANDADANFCKKCGKTFEMAAANAAPSEAPTAAQATQESESPTPTVETKEDESQDR